MSEQNKLVGRDVGAGGALEAPGDYRIEKFAVDGGKVAVLHFACPCGCGGRWMTGMGDDRKDFPIVRVPFPDQEGVWPKRVHWRGALIAGVWTAAA